ncbi:PAC2 family protein [Brachybacterium subflavum]|uniref:PAC2 family protein n=1 Tax=Brachybacterium subflavum TaxID=2585206 RepID=UPI0012660C97|nr:PAC2 family protein [Brachybacterium subflavum]
MTRIAICAFSGWNDAGEAATGAIEHLLSAWPSRTIARIPAEEYVDFQVHRPELRLDADGRKVLDWPDTRIELVTPPRGPELLLVHGAEPSLRWGAFCRQVLDRLLGADATRLISLGALLADAPHTRPLPVSDQIEPGTAEQADAESYEGPIGIPTVLARAAVSLGVRTSSIWVQVPHYVSQNASPKAVLALVRALQDHVSAPLPMQELEEDAEAWERGVEELSRNDPDISEYVARLEEAQDAEDLPEASGDAIAKEFERFLRRREGED